METIEIFRGYDYRNTKGTYRLLVILLIVACIVTVLAFAFSDLLLLQILIVGLLLQYIIQLVIFKTRVLITINNENIKLRRSYFKMEVLDWQNLDKVEIKGGKATFFYEKDNESANFKFGDLHYDQIQKLKKSLQEYCNKKDIKLIA